MAPPTSSGPPTYMQPGMPGVMQPGMPGPSYVGAYHPGMGHLGMAPPYTGTHYGQPSAVQVTPISTYAVLSYAEVCSSKELCNIRARAH